jgi:hypothetical protein
MTDPIQQQIDRISQQVDQYFQVGHYQEAIELATHACDLAKSHLGNNHPDTAQSLNNLGVCLTCPA